MMQKLYIIAYKQGTPTIIPSDQYLPEDFFGEYASREEAEMALEELRAEQ